MDNIIATRKKEDKVVTKKGQTSQDGAISYIGQINNNNNNINNFFIQDAATLFNPAH